MAALAPVVGATAVVQPAKLYGRTQPGRGKGTVKVTRKKGFKFKIQARRKVGGLWWVRGKSLWYAYKHLKPIVHKRVVDVAALNARDKPSTKSKVVGTRKRGYVIQYVAIVKSGGLSWLMSRWGNFYAAKHTRPYKVAPKGSAAAVGTAKVNSPVPGYGVNYAYGVRNSGYAAGIHTGEDRAAPVGAKIVAVHNGTIIRADWGGAYGNWTLLKADNGHVYLYAHQSSRSVRVGQKVKAGQIIGYVGVSGNVTGPHLHFEMSKGSTWSYGNVQKPTW